MRTRAEIQFDFGDSDYEIPKHQMRFLLEVLLDIRDLLSREK